MATRAQLRRAVARKLDAHDLGVGRDCRCTAQKHSRIAQVAGYRFGYKVMCFSHDFHVSFSSVRRAMHGALRDRARERRFDKSSCQEQRVRDAKWQAHCHEGQREE